MKKAIFLLLIILIFAIFGTAIFAKFNYYSAKFLNAKIESAQSTATTQTTSTTQSTNSTAQITAPVDTKIKAANGFTVYDFASNVTNARDLQLSPGGTLLVSETSQGKVVALPDKDQNGTVDDIKVVIDGLSQPHGLAFYKGQLYVAESNQLTRYNWDESTLTAKKDKQLFTLPTQLASRHFTRGLEFDAQGNLYVSIGSTCDTCLESNEQFASVLISNSNGDNPHLYAKGLRNAVFLKLNPTTNQVWATEMSRDYLGANLPADEMNIVKQDLNYGWPYCYGDKVKDHTFTQGNSIDCAQTESPIYQVPAHSAPLGLTFIKSEIFPNDWQGDLLVAYHGSNQGTTAGYKVVRQIVNGNSITGEEDFLTGFLGSNKPGSATTRPVDVEFAQNGNLYVSDDKAGKIYLISKMK